MGEVPEWLLLFRTGPLRFGFDVDAVERVIPACAMNPLPGAPASIRGVTVVSDEIIPVVDPTTPFKGGAASAIDLESRLGLACRFVIVQTPKRVLAVLAEEVDGVRHGGDMQFGDTASLTEAVPQLKGISVGADGLIYISDIDRLISDSEEIQLQAVMANIPHESH